MANSYNVTNSKDRLRKAFKKANESVTGVSSKELTKTVENSNKLFLGKVVKWFSPTNKVTVKLSGSNKLITCTILHNIISKNANVSYSPKGTVLLDEESQEYYIEPHDTLYCIVCELKSNNPRFVFLGFINENLKFKENASPGEYNIQVGKSEISLNEKRINIKSKELFINGLNYKQPKLENYSDNKQLEDKLNSIETKINKSIDDKINEFIIDNIDLSNYLIDFDLDFYGISGIDDTLRFKINLKKK